MGAIPGEIDTDRQPPMAVPLRHFVVGFAFLVSGAVITLLMAVDAVGGTARLAILHLLLVGWVCVTIMGAMTQFVPVWSGVSLHSRRLAAAELPLVALGLLGLSASFLTGRTALAAPAGIALLVGLWTFVYNVGRTLPPARELDVTEAHFALALAFFALLAPLGLLLAVGLSRPVATTLPVARHQILATHATVAVFGAVLTTVLGALYQLSTMFTQTELHGVDVPLQRFETLAYPSGVALLGAGRLIGHGMAARLGAVLVATGLLAVAVIVARRLIETRVDWTPMLSRYAALVVTTLLWVALSLPAWIDDPLRREALLGAPGTERLLLLGVVGFVVLGTLYHVVPFVVWVHRYSDRLGFEPVPMIDDLYDGRVAAADFWLFVAGTGALVAADVAGVDQLATPGAVSFLLGTALVAGNVIGVVVRHSPESLRTVVLGGLSRRGA